METRTRDPYTNETVYSGDDFYTATSIPSNESSEIQLKPRGNLRAWGETKTLKASWRRWVCSSEYGVYEPRGGASGTRTLGLPQFKGNGETFLRSLNHTNGRYTYGRIHCVNNKWVIGDIGSSSGWHEGSEPQVGSSVTFAFKRNEGSDAAGSNITVSFDRYVSGGETDAGLLGEVAVWR